MEGFFESDWYRLYAKNVIAVKLHIILSIFLLKKNLIGYKDNKIMLNASFFFFFSPRVFFSANVRGYSLLKQSMFLDVQKF